VGVKVLNICICTGHWKKSFDFGESHNRGSTSGFLFIGIGGK